LRCLLNERDRSLIERAGSFDGRYGRFLIRNNRTGR
jgi:hypothetical protein